MSATSIEHVIKAVEEVICDHGGAERTIASEYRFKHLAWPGRAPEDLAKLARSNPLAYVSIGPQQPHDVVQEMGSACRYDAQVTIEMAHYWGHEGRKEELRAAEMRAAGDFHRLRSALCFPANLATTSGAVATGLASGCLRADGARWAVKRDISARLLFATAVFNATVFLDFPS